MKTEEEKRYFSGYLKLFEDDDFQKKKQEENETGGSFRDKGEPEDGDGEEESTQKLSDDQIEENDEDSDESEEFGDSSMIPDAVKRALEQEGVDPDSVDSSIIDAMTNILNTASAEGDGELSPETAQDILGRFIEIVGGDVTQAVELMDQYVKDYGEESVAAAASGEGGEQFGEEDGEKGSFPPKGDSGKPAFGDKDGVESPSEDGEEGEGGKGGTNPFAKKSKESEEGGDSSEEEPEKDESQDEPKPEKTDEDKKKKEV